jgi:hypothetical protein
MFTGGGCLHKSLWDKRGQDRWDVGILFETGVLLATNSAQTKVSGFDAGMFAVSTLSIQQGTDPQMSTAELQLKDSNEFNALHTFFKYDEIGANLADVGGVVETKITYDPNPSAATTVDVKVVSACNTGDVILGLDDAANWNLGGVQATSTTISGVTFDADTGVYTITVSPILVDDDTVAPKLVSGADDVAEDALGNLFKGQAALFTIDTPSV